MFFFPKIACTAALASLVFLPSCATVIRPGNQNVSIESQPSGLEFVLKDPDGNIAATGRTPQKVSVNTGWGYFKPAVYTIQTKRGGKVLSEQTITPKVNAWYFGNILIGGVIGLLIVDPLTGSMYSFENPTVIAGTTTAEASGQRTLSIASIDTLTPEQRAKLVRL